MTVRVSPTEPIPTHHISLTNRDGTTVGLIMCDAKGNPAPAYNKVPVDRTALKTSTGNSGYADLQYPYSPITQDTWEGGRGGLDFERDSTRYYDGNAINTRRSNKAFLGPQIQYTKGYKTLDYKVPGRYTGWLEVANATTDILEWVPTSNYTMDRIWINARRLSGTDETLTFKLYEDGALISTIVTTLELLDEVGQWIELGFAHAVVTTKTYKITALVTSQKRIQIMCVLSSLLDTAAKTNACYIAETAAVDQQSIFYEYKGQQYVVINQTGGNPKIYMNGDRGTCDSNAGQLTKLIDATKTWTVNQWAGCVAKVNYGPGSTEAVPYKTIVSNTATELVFADDWSRAHTTDSEYVILGSDTWQELTGHGMNRSVTAVLPVNYIVYFALGDGKEIVSHREYTTAGAWSANNWRSEGKAANVATFLVWMPITKKIARATNQVSGGVPSVAIADAVAYGTDLTFSTDEEVGDNIAGKYSLINGLNVYPDDDGVESLWIYKEEIPYIQSSGTGRPLPITLPEMESVPSRKNGAATQTFGVYNFFTLGNGLQRYYGGTLEDLGPNIGEGLPSDRSGQIVSLLGYPGRLLAIVDGGSSGHSSLLERSGSGWHEIYRAPHGERMYGMALQTIPGSTIERLWIYQGNLIVWLPFANDAQNELNDGNYLYSSEGSLTISRMHAGMFDVQKMIKTIKVWTDALDGTGGQKIYIDYRLDDDTAWTVITDRTLVQSPVSALDMTSVYGIAGKRIQLRVRFETNDNTKTPILLALIVEAVLRIQVKYMYHINFRVMDDEPTLTAGEQDDKSITAAGMSAMTKLAIIETWADADSNSLLLMRSRSPLYDNKYVFINPPQTSQVANNPEEGRPWTGATYTCAITAQEA